MSAGRDERGQVTILVLGLALVCFATAGLAVDGTRAFLLRRTLQNAADGAALAGASTLDRTSYYATGGARVVLDATAARRTTARWLDLRGVAASASIETNLEAVEVTLRSEMPTSFLGLVGIDRLTVGAEARSEPVPGPP
ncbi:MAG: pilus assembly protein TadG-related protein [Actinomycetota bacterium]